VVERGRRGQAKDERNYGRFAPTRERQYDVKNRKTRARSDLNSVRTDNWIIHTISPSSTGRKSGGSRSDLIRPNRFPVVVRVSGRRAPDVHTLVYIRVRCNSDVDVR